MWLTFMAHIVFLLLSADVEHTLELYHPRAEGAEVLPTNFHASLVECCSQGCHFPSITTCPMHQQASAASKHSQAELQDLAIGSHQCAQECRGCGQSTSSPCCAVPFLITNIHP